MLKITDRRGQIWEWNANPGGRYYIVRSHVGDHPADNMPVMFHDMLDLNSGELIEGYVEMTNFERLETPNDPEMRRIL